MHRRAVVLLAILTIAATLVLGACGGSSGPTISDPKEIITKAVAAMQKAKAVHLEATVDGTISSALSGIGAGSDMSLAGTTLKGDLDLANQNAHISAGVPALLGMTADIIIVGSDTYTRVSIAGEKYSKSTTAAGSPTDPATAIKQVTDFLDRPEVAPTKKNDASCGSKSCYAVEIPLTAAELASLLPGTDVGDATVTATILVAKDSLYPASATITATGSTLGDLTVKLVLSDWDKAITISAPPADQVQ